MTDGWQESKDYVLGHVDVLRDQVARLTDAVEQLVLMAEHHKRSLAHVMDCLLEIKETQSRAIADNRERLITLEARLRLLQQDPGTDPGRPIRIPGNGHDEEG